MGTDGVWDDVNYKDVKEAVEKNKSKGKISEDLVTRIFKHAAESSNQTVEEIKNLPLGTRRRYHDDITLIVVDLKNQA